MSSNPKPLKVPVAAGFGLFVAGLLGWLWLGDWRLAVTGAALLILGAVLAGVSRGGDR